MSQYVTDTHALFWHLAKDSRLSPAARRLFQEADAGLHQVYLSAITLVEMVYLVERGRIQSHLLEQVLDSLDIPDGSYAVAPVDRQTARALSHVPRSQIPDMPDRIIVATAYQLGLALITRDAEIRKARVVEVVW